MLATATPPELQPKHEAVEPLTVSVFHAAKLLNVHPNTVRRHCRNKVLPSCRLGGRVLIPVAALKKLVSGELPA